MLTIENLPHKCMLMMKLHENLPWAITETIQIGAADDGCCSLRSWEMSTVGGKSFLQEAYMVIGYISWQETLTGLRVMMASSIDSPRERKGWKSLGFSISNLFDSERNASTRFMVQTSLDHTCVIKAYKGSVYNIVQLTKAKLQLCNMTSKKKKT